MQIPHDNSVFARDWIKAHSVLTFEPPGDPVHNASPPCEYAVTIAWAVELSYQPKTTCESVTQGVPEARRLKLLAVPAEISLVQIDSPDFAFRQTSSRSPLAPVFRGQKQAPAPKHGRTGAWSWKTYRPTQCLACAQVNGHALALRDAFRPLASAKLRPSL